MYQECWLLALCMCSCRLIPMEEIDDKAMYLFNTSTVTYEVTFSWKWQELVGNICIYFLLQYQIITQSKSTLSQIPFEAMVSAFVDMSFQGAISLRYVFLCICTLYMYHWQIVHLSMDYSKKSTFQNEPSLLWVIASSLLLFLFSILVEKLKHQYI